MVYTINTIVRRYEGLYTVLAGRNRAVQINEAIRVASLLWETGGQRTNIYLQEGEYELESPIVAKSGVTLCGSGDKTILRPKYGDTADADVVANHVIGADGTINTTKMSTTLTTHVFKDASSIVVAAAGTIAAGDWILIQGHNTASSYPQDAAIESNGTDVILSEVVQVASTYVSGLTIPLARPVRQHHGTTGITVRAVAAVVNFEVRDLQIKGSLDGYCIAVGIMGRYSWDITIGGTVSISGCSRRNVEMIGVNGFAVEVLRSRGNSNGWLMLDSTSDFEIDLLIGDRGVARVHALGVPRFPVMEKRRCTNGTFHRVKLRGVSSGMYLSGGEHITVEEFEASDIAITTAIWDRMIAGGEIQDGSGGVTLGFGTGMAPLEIAEYGFDITVGSIRCEGLVVPNEAAWTAIAPYRAVAVDLHDMLSGHVGQISVINRGAVSRISAVMFSDYMGKVDSIEVSGYTHGVSTNNLANDFVVDRYRYDGRGGETPNANVPFYLNHQTANNHTIHFGDVKVTNPNQSFRAGSIFRVGTSYTGDFRFRIGVLNNDGREYCDVIMARNESATEFAIGDVVEVDSTSLVNDYQKVIGTASASGYERRLFVVASPEDKAGASYILGCTLPARLATIKATTALVNKGAVLEYAATRRCAENASAAHPIGRALDYKASGAEGLIRVGLVNS